MADDGDERRDDAPPRRTTGASVQIQVPDGMETVCPACDETVDSSDMLLSLSLGPLGGDSLVFLVTEGRALDEVVDEIRATLVRRALERTHGNIARAAASLDVKYTTFYSMVRRLGLTDAVKSAGRPPGKGRASVAPEGTVPTTGAEPVPGGGRQAAPGAGSPGGHGPGEAPERDPDPGDGPSDSGS